MCIIHNVTRRFPHHKSNNIKSVLSDYVYIYVMINIWYSNNVYPTASPGIAYRHKRTAIYITCIIIEMYTSHKYYVL